MYMKKFLAKYEIKSKCNFCFLYLINLSCPTAFTIRNMIWMLCCTNTFALPRGAIGVLCKFLILVFLFILLDLFIFIVIHINLCVIDQYQSWQVGRGKNGKRGEREKRKTEKNWEKTKPKGHSTHSSTQQITTCCTCKKNIQKTNSTSEKCTILHVCVYMKEKHIV